MPKYWNTVNLSKLRLRPDPSEISAVGTSDFRLTTETQIEPFPPPRRSRLRSWDSRQLLALIPLILGFISVLSEKLGECCSNFTVWQQSQGGKGELRRYTLLLSAVLDQGRFQLLGCHAIPAVLLVSDNECVVWLICTLCFDLKQYLDLVFHYILDFVARNPSKWFHWIHAWWKI